MKKSRCFLNPWLNLKKNASIYILFWLLFLFKNVYRIIQIKFVEFISLSFYQA